jgi:DNA-binding transcriptional LysR family regulator
MRHRQTCGGRVMIGSTLNRSVEIPEPQLRRLPPDSLQDPWLGIKLRHLATLVVVAEEGSFHRAAQRLGFVQSAVSQQIAALERVVGRRLVERSRGPGRVSLTRAGEELRTQACEVLAKLATVRDSLGQVPGGASRSLRIGIEPGAEWLLRTRPASLPGRLGGIELEEDQRRIERVLDASLDFAVVDARSRMGVLGRRMLFADRYVLLTPEGSRLPRIQVPEDLLHLALVDGGDRIEPGAETVCHVRGRLGYPVAVELVASGVGLAIVPSMFVRDRHVHVRALPLEGVLAPRVLALCWRTDRPVSEHAGSVAVAIRDDWLKWRAG